MKKEKYIEISTLIMLLACFSPIFIAFLYISVSYIILLLSSIPDANFDTSILLFLPIIPIACWSFWCVWFLSRQLRSNSTINPNNTLALIGLICGVILSCSLNILRPDILGLDVVFCYLPLIGPLFIVTMLIVKQRLASSYR